MTPPVVALAVLAGAAFVVLALVHPRLSLLSLVALDVSGLNGVLAGQVGVSPYQPQLVLALLVTGVLVRRRRLRLAWSPVLLGVGVLIAGFCLTLPGAVDPVTAVEVLGSRCRDLLYFVVVWALLVSLRQAEQLAAAVVVVLAGLAALTLVHALLLDSQGDLAGLSQVPVGQEGGARTARHAGTAADVNFWARLLTMVTPLSLSLLALSRGPRRLLWAGCALSLVVGVYLTQSRGGFIAVGVAVVAWLALAGGRYRRTLLVLPLVLAVLVPVTGIGSRLGTLVATGAGAVGSDLSVLTRTRLQLAALRMFLDAPLNGHGVGSYGFLFSAHDRLAGDYRPIDIEVAAHNLYLEQAADGGLVLLLAWAVFLGTVGFALHRARVLTGRRTPVGLLALGVLAGLLGWAVASLFLHLSDFRALLLLAALAAALDVAARDLDRRSGGRYEAPERPGAPDRDRAPGRPLPRLVPVAAAVLAVVLATAALTLGLRSGPRYSATATLAVLPAAQVVDWTSAYQLDLVSRGLVVPTVATALGSTLTPEELARRTGQPVDPGVQVEVQPSTLGGAVLVEVTGPDRARVAQLAGAAPAVSGDLLARWQTGYLLAGTTSAPSVRTGPAQWAAWLLAGSATVPAVLCAGQARRRTRRRRTGRQAAWDRFVATPAGQP